MEERCAQIANSAREIAREYWPDLEHSEQVRKLSMELFDSLQDLHKLGKKERCWLECAAILHDIGLWQGSKGHHKNSMKLILNDSQLPISSTERRVISNIARYHRKGGPQNIHYNFTSLSSELKQKTAILAGILRLADGLDFSHQSIVQKAEAQATVQNVAVQGSVFVNPILEEYAVNKKKDLFEKTFKTKVVLTWKHIQRPQQLTQPSQTSSATTDLANNQKTLRARRYSSNKRFAEQQQQGDITK